MGCVLNEFKPNRLHFPSGFTVNNSRTKMREGIKMKRTALIMLVVILLVLLSTVPAFADPPNGKACDHIWGSGHFYGWFIGNGKGIPWGPMWGATMNGCSW